jgi:hypothetical protein
MVFLWNPAICPFLSTSRFILLSRIPILIPWLFYPDKLPENHQLFRINVYLKHWNRQ